MAKGKINSIFSIFYFLYSIFYFLLKKNKLRCSVIVGVFLFFFTSCENDIEKVILLSENDKFPTEYSEDVELLYSDSALKKFKLNAPVLQRYSTDSVYTEFPKGVKVIVYNDKGEEESILTANYAIQLESVDKIIAKNNVVIINRFGEKLNTEHIMWDKKTEKIYSDEFVKITTKDEIIYGDGLEANQDFSKYKIKNIKGTIQVKENE